MPEAQPNILWICTDQQRFDTIGALGNPHIITPNLDRLVDQGVAFTRTYCQNPICQPSRASFMTSLYPSTLHINGNGVEGFPSAVPLVSKLFRDGGYECGLVGKLHLNTVGRGVEKRTNDGYSYWHYSHAPHWHPPHYPITQGHDYADWVKARGGDLSALLNDPDGIPAKYHQTTWCGEKTREFIQKDRQRPWFASVNFFYPHPPFNPAKEYLGRYDPDAMPSPLYRPSDLHQQERLDLIPFQRKANPPDELEIGKRKGQTENYLGGRMDAGAVKSYYYALITQIDDQIGEIMDLLEETGQIDNTVVVFTSDHGEMLGDHGLLYKGCRFYEGGVRVPLIFNWPKRFQARTKATGLVELIDITPTLLDLADLPVPEHMQGRSLTPILFGRANPHRFREFARCESYDAESNNNRDGKPGYGTMIRTDRYKLVVYHGYDLGELYDLEKDAGEFDNLWDDPACRELKLSLMKKSFDATVLATDWGGAPNFQRRTKEI